MGLADTGRPHREPEGGQASWNRRAERAGGHRAGPQDALLSQQKDERKMKIAPTSSSATATAPQKLDELVKNGNFQLCKETYKKRNVTFLFINNLVAEGGLEPPTFGL